MYGEFLCTVYVCVWYVFASVRSCACEMYGAYIVYLCIHLFSICVVCIYMKTVYDASDLCAYASGMCI